MAIYWTRSLSDSQNILETLLRTLEFHDVGHLLDCIFEDMFTSVRGLRPIDYVNQLYLSARRALTKPYHVFGNRLEFKAVMKAELPGHSRRVVVFSFGAKYADLSRNRNQHDPFICDSMGGTSDSAASEVTREAESHISRHSSHSTVSWSPPKSTACASCCG